MKKDLEDVPHRFAAGESFPAFHQEMLDSLEIVSQASEDVESEVRFMLKKWEANKGPNATNATESAALRREDFDAWMKVARGDSIDVTSTSSTSWFNASLKIEFAVDLFSFKTVADYKTDNLILLEGVADPGAKLMMRMMLVKLQLI